MQYINRYAAGLIILTAILCGAAIGQRAKPKRRPAASPKPTATLIVTPTPTPAVTPVPTPMPTPTPTKEEILDSIDAGAKTYIETFKNLLADETKTFELYGKNGEVKKKRIVQSNFIVFPLMKAEGQVVEFRNVTSVDGKKIGDSDKRASDLIAKLASAETSDSELNRLRDESSRHDLDIAISGMTLFQALAVDKGLRDSFEFIIRPAAAGASTLTIEYRQVKDTPDISVNSTASRPVGRAGLNYDIDIDKEMPLTARLNGTIVVDSAASKIISETRNVTVQPEKFAAPVTVVEDRFEYQDGAFGIFTPKHITHTQYMVSTRDMRAVKQLMVTFDYGNFSRPGVEVKAGEVKQ